MLHVHVHDDLHVIWIARAVFILSVLYLWDSGRSGSGNGVCMFVCLLTPSVYFWCLEDGLGMGFWIRLEIKDGAFGDVPEIYEMR